MGIRIPTLGFVHQCLFGMDTSMQYRGLMMVELGGQILRIFGGRYRAKDYFEQMGFIHYSIDINALNGAYPLDLTKPITSSFWRGRFDILTNLGTLEHVSDQYECWNNMHNLVKTNGVYISMIPFTGVESNRGLNAGKHCDYYYWPDGVANILKINNYKILDIEEVPSTGCAGYFYRKTADSDFKITREQLNSFVRKYEISGNLRPEVPETDSQCVQPDV